MQNDNHNNARKVAAAEAAIFADLKLDNAPDTIREGSVAWVQTFLDDNADMLGRVTTDHLLGMLITNAFARVSAVNAGHHGVPQFGEAYAFCHLWTMTRRIPASAYNASRSVAAL